MNERIKELAEQAGMTDDKFGLFFAKDRHEEGVDLEKFAELVIRDCVKMCYETTGNSYLNGVAAGTKIMLHFGVTNERTN